MYLDSAIIVKLFIAEPDSGFYASLVDGRTDLTVSALSLPECRSALARKVDEGEITHEEYLDACAGIDEIFTGRLGINVAGVDNETLRLAALLIERCRGRVALRALDAVHVATCLKHGISPLATNDRIMRKAAGVLQLTLTPLPQ